MNYTDLQNANKTIKTTDIKGKAYADVNERIRVFRMLYPNGTIETEIISVQDGICIIKATVLNEDGRIIGTGLAYEKENSTFINKTSYIENCETSAVGRALGMCGIGIDTSIASYEEVQNAINNQNVKAKQDKTTNQLQKKEIGMLKADIDRLLELAKTKGVTEAKLYKKYNVKNLFDLTPEQYESCYNGLMGM